LFLKLGFTYPGKMGDDFLFKANKDRDSEFTVDDFVRVFRLTKKIAGWRRRDGTNFLLS